MIWRLTHITGFSIKIVSLREALHMKNLDKSGNLPYRRDGGCPKSSDSRLSTDKKSRVQTNKSKFPDLRFWAYFSD